MPPPGRPDEAEPDPLGRSSDRPERRGRGRAGHPVLLLVTIGLVLASSVLLLIGFVQDTIAVVYSSMACAAAAAVVLVVVSHLAHRHTVRLAQGGLDGDPEPQAAPEGGATGPGPGETAGMTTGPDQTAGTATAGAPVPETPVERPAEAGEN